MRILIEIEPENIFERTPLLHCIKTFLKTRVRDFYKIKKLDIKILDKTFGNNKAKFKGDEDGN